MFFPFGDERKRRFTDSNPHIDLSSCFFKGFHDSCKVLFSTDRDYTVERIKLYKTIFMVESVVFHKTDGRSNLRRFGKQNPKSAGTEFTCGTRVSHDPNETSKTDFLLAPIVLTAKRDGSTKYALNAKSMNT